MIDIKITDKREQTIEGLLDLIDHYERSLEVKIARQEAEIRMRLVDQLRGLRELYARGRELMESGAADYIRKHLE